MVPKITGKVGEMCSSLNIWAAQRECMRSWVVQEWLPVPQSEGRSSGWYPWGCWLRWDDVFQAQEENISGWITRLSTEMLPTYKVALTQLPWSAFVPLALVFPSHRYIWLGAVTTISPQIIWEIQSYARYIFLFCCLFFSFATCGKRVRTTEQPLPGMSS